MFQLFKNQSNGGNGEFIIVTNEKKPEEFKRHLCAAIMEALIQYEGDEEFSIDGIIPSALDAYERLISKERQAADHQWWIRTGFTEDLTECTLVYNSK